MDGNNKHRTNPRRRDILRGIGAAAVIGTVGLATTGTAAGTTSARTETIGDNVFLGGDYFELGVRGDGGFGPEVDAPESFYGHDRGFEPEHSSVDYERQIGMYADLDGFSDEQPPQFRYEYFLPGTPEERWSAGYRDGETDHTASNGRTAGETMPTSVTPTSSGDVLAAELESTFDGTLQIDQTYRFERPDRFFEIEVTLTNIGESTIQDVRYQRSVDPDNGVDTGCEFTTKNTILSQPPTSNEALVVAEIREGDDCELAEHTTAPFFYYSPSDRARVSSGSSSTSLEPGPVVYAPEDYENAPSEGTQATEDVYVAITFDVGDLDPGASAGFSFFPALTDDIDETLEDISGCIERRHAGRDVDAEDRCDFDEADRKTIDRTRDRERGRGEGDRGSRRDTPRRGRGR